MDDLPLYVITGLSGAGKSQAIQAFEDMGFYCVDNLPSGLVLQLIEHCRDQHSEIEGIALVLDVREGNFVEELPPLLDKLRKKNLDLEVLFLEASPDILLNRYKESRRPHPLREEYDLHEAIKVERDRLQPVRQEADRVIDTSRMTPHQFRGMLTDLHTPKSEADITVSFTSFGFKNGAPTHLDSLFDARFLPNPYYESELEPLKGTDQKIKDFFERTEVAQQFLRQLQEMLNFMAEQYSQEGKNLLSIGIACTGGRHRSVYLAEELADYLDARDFIKSVVVHRDLDEAEDSQTV